MSRRFVGERASGVPWILCLDCGMKSYHPTDVEELWCANCGRDDILACNLDALACKEYERHQGLSPFSEPTFRQACGLEARTFEPMSWWGRFRCRVMLKHAWERQVRGVAIEGAAQIVQWGFPKGSYATQLVSESPPVIRVGFVECQRCGDIMPPQSTKDWQAFQRRGLGRTER